MPTKAALTIAVLVLLAGCPEPPPDLSIAPSFNSVLRAGDDIITRTRLDEPNANWSSYVHNGVEYPHCVDMVVSPNAGQRFLAYIRQDAGDWSLFVRTGLGNANWSTDEIELPISDLEFPTCAHISHLRDDLYAIVWQNGDTLESALFVPGNPVGLELREGESISGHPFETTRRISLTHYDGEVFLVWTTEDDGRIRTMRGQVSESELTFSGIATFADADFTSHSIVVAGEDGLYIATSDGEQVKLLHSGGNGTQWSTVASCDSNRNIMSSLLYVDQAGTWTTLLTNPAVTNETLLNLSNCSTTEFQVPIARGWRILYSPGS